MNTVSDSPRIIATERDLYHNRWLYKLDNGEVVHSQYGDARIPCGLPYNEHVQWGANQLSKVGLRHVGTMLK